MDNINNRITLYGKPTCIYLFKCGMIIFIIIYIMLILSSIFIFINTDTTNDVDLGSRINIILERPNYLLIFLLTLIVISLLSFFFQTQISYVSGQKHITIKSLFTTEEIRIKGVKSIAVNMSDTMKYAIIEFIAAINNTNKNITNKIKNDNIYIFLREINNAYPDLDIVFNDGFNIKHLNKDVENGFNYLKSRTIKNNNKST